MPIRWPNKNMCPPSSAIDKASIESDQTRTSNKRRKPKKLKKTSKGTKKPKTIENQHRKHTEKIAHKLLILPPFYLIRILALSRVKHSKL